MKIENLKSDEIGEAGNFIKIVFDGFVDAEYPGTGVVHFYKIISAESISERISDGSLINVVKSNNRIIGYIEIINSNHIYLLFIEKEFHKKGIAGRLIDFSINQLLENNPGLSFVTVNSTSFALKIYEKLGFEKIADFQLKNGILSFPMKKTLR